jgi:hypothetical protein
VAGQVRCPRMGLSTLSPGSFGHQSPGIMTGAGGASLGWDRRRRVTPAQTASQETWPEAEPWGRRLPLVRAVVGRRQTSCPAGQRRTRWCGGCAHVCRRSASFFICGGPSSHTPSPPAAYGMTRSGSAGRFCQWRRHSSGAEASREGDRLRASSIRSLFRAAPHPGCCPGQVTGPAIAGRDEAL